MMTHLIRQQYLHVEAGCTEAEGLALQRRLPALFAGSIRPAMESTLDRYAPPDRQLAIERLEIDAGSLTMEDLDRVLADSVAQALEKALREIARHGRCDGLSGSVVEKSPGEMLADAFIHFLHTGTLPWSFRLPEGRNLEQAILIWWNNPAAPAAMRRAGGTAILPLLLASTPRQRLIRQFSLPFLETLLHILSTTSHDALKEILPAVRSMSLPSAVLREVERELWDSTFARLATGVSLSTRDLITEALRKPVSTGKVHVGGASELEHLWPEVMESLRKQELSGGSGDRESTARAETAAPHEVGPLPASAPSPHLRELAREGIYVENAGCVLLHPFLPAFFEALEIAAGKKLLDPERALCLLHFLVTGSTVAPEYEVMLLKALCNIELETPVESEVALTETEREEADALLRAVIRHWEALGNTSPDALRGTFLLRPGKLSLRHDGDWLLQVESQTCDILLDQLPWGISAVKLPWMERMLWVEWR